MTDTKKQPAMAYPTPDQYEDWKQEASEQDMSISEWMQAMIEAGRKKFDVDIEPDETAHELREQRNDLKNELEHARERIGELEAQLYNSEQQTIHQFVQKNPGSTYSQITREVIDTVPERVNEHLDELEGKVLYIDDEGYYPMTEENGRA